VTHSPVQADGQMKTGSAVLIRRFAGAEEFGRATARCGEGCSWAQVNINPVG